MSSQGAYPLKQGGEIMEKTIPVCELTPDMKVVRVFEDTHVCEACPKRHECRDFGRCCAVREKKD